MSPSLRNVRKTSSRWPVSCWALSEEHHKRVQGFDRLAEAALQRYPWPGNIRELRNTLRSALLLADGSWITASNLNLDLTLKQEEMPCLTEEEKERQLLLQTLKQVENNRARAARMLDISRTTLYEKLRKYGSSDGKGFGTGGMVSRPPYEFPHLLFCVSECLYLCLPNDKNC